MEVGRGGTGECWGVWGGAGLQKRVAGILCHNIMLA